MQRKRPQGHRLRLGRFSEPGRIYLVTFVTDNRTPLFTHLLLGRIVARTLGKAAMQVTTYCFVVMPDHVHWLLQLRDGQLLSSVVQSVKSISAHQINRTLRRSGRVWQAGFHDHALRREEDVKAVARYVIANPLRAGLVERIGDYALWDAMWV